MAISVVTLADLIQQLIAEAIGEDAKTHPLLSGSLGKRWLMEGYREIVRRTKILTAQHNANLLAVASHDAPTDILDRITGTILVKTAAGKNLYPDERDWFYARKTYGDFTFPNGETGPADWCWDARNNGKILLLPPPAAAVTSGLFLDYVQDPGALSRLYDPAEATASVHVINGDASVDVNADLTGLIVAGDAFGVKADDDSLPTVWYKVLSITSLAAGTFELTENYAEVTDTTAPFTLSQVSPVEYKRPGLVRFAPVEYALAKWRVQEEGGVLDFVAFNAEIARILSEIGDRPNVQLQGVDYRRFPANLR